jgi:DNA-binding response OmpR family regulator
MDGKKWMVQESIVLGRDPNCDITIHNRQVSRNHAKVFNTDEGIFIEDLGSKNGTHRNGKQVTKPVKLSEGDVIHIALAQKFIYMSADATLPLDNENLLTNLHLVQSRLKLDKLSRRVWICDKEIIPPLSVSQFRLLEILYKSSGKLVSRNKVMATVWGEENAFEISDQALDALVRRLRDRLASVDPDYSYVITVRGHGLRLDNPQK